jgi:WD40 repeat protein/serine/threonine protein kinase
MASLNPRGNEIFAAALKLDSPQARQAYLDEVCRTDPELRSQVEALLQTLVSAVIPPGPATATAGREFPTTPLPSRPSTAVGTIIAGRYKLVQLIGEGGMGTVWMAEQQKPVRRLVALKIILAGLDSSQALARFEAERQALALMDHPHIARVFDGGTTDAGRPFFVMELVKGTPITAYCDTNRRTVRQRLELFVQTCQAIQHAHQKGIIHRDIKPSNVLVALYDEKPVVKVIDFGVAKAAGQRLTDKTLYTEFGAMVGTVQYMSPEQAALNNLDIDTRSDIYSLGVMLYELLTGTTPLEKARTRGKELAVLLAAVLEEEPPRPSSRLTQAKEGLSIIAARRQMEPAQLTNVVKGELDWIVMKALEKDRTRRYETANGFAMDVGRYLAGEPVLAAPPSASYRLRKLARKHRAGLATAATIVLLLAGALTAVVVVQAKANRELTSVNQQLTEANDERETARATAERERDAAQWREYRANMEAVSSALNLNNVAEARRLLEASNPDHRGWEWRHFMTRLDGAKAVLRHSAGVWYVSFNRDGTRLVTASKDGWFRVWDAATGQELFHRRFSDQEDANGYAFAGFLPDGRVLSMNRVGKARIWKPDAPDTPVDAETPVVDAYGAWLSPNGSYVAWYNLSATEIWGWDFRQQRAPERLAKNVIGNIAFNRDGQLMALPAEGGGFVTWDVARRCLIRRFAGHPVRPDSFAFSLGSDRLVCGSFFPETEVALWTAEGKTINRQNVHRNSTNDVAYSPDSSRIASSSLDQTIGLWHGATLEPVALLRGHTGPVMQVQFTPDSKRLVSRSDDQSVRLWEADRGDPVGVLHGHTELINHFALSPNGNTLASASNDGTVRLWDLKQAEAHNGLRGHTSYVYDASFSPDGTQIASAAWDGTVRLWDATTLQELAVLKQETEREPAVHCVVWSRDGRRLAVAARSHFVHIWDAKERKKLRTLDVPNYHWRSDIRAAFNPDGTLLATGNRDGMVALWNPETGAKVAQWNGQHRVDAENAFTGDVAFSPDGQTLATVGANNVLRLWRVADVRAGRTSEPLATLKGHADVIHRVVWSKDGKWLATASQDRSVRLWSAVDQKEIAALPHGSVVYGLALSPDEKRLASGCADNTIRIWDLATHDQVAELRGHNAYVKSVAFSPDGAQLVSASGDYTIRIWDTDLVQERAKRAAAARRP